MNAPKKITVPLAQNETNQCAITPPWFVNKSEYHVLPAAFRPLVNGEEAFPAVYRAIQAAKKSVCIICWGFQPSMYFVRSDQGNSMPIGGLLELMAMGGVKVRVLSFAVNPLWAGVAVTGKAMDESNLPGRHELSLGKDRPPQSTEEMYRYDMQWYLRYDDQQVGADTLGKAMARGLDPKKRTDNLRFTSRGFSIIDRFSIGLRGHMDKGASNMTSTVLASTPSHHQKMVLVDYEDPQNAVGFVMGHNMLDAYWDHSTHSCHKKAPSVGRNGNHPWQDMSSCVRGPILGDLFANFSQAWKKETGEVLPGAKFENYPTNATQSSEVVVAQILRTQPQYGVQDIKKLYLQAVKNATQYIYIENQYFRWPPLAEQIKLAAQAQTAAGRCPERHDSLHLFVVTNSSDDGMGKGVVNTYRMLDSLGRADTIPEVARQERADDANARLNRTRVEADTARRSLPDLQFAASRNPNGALAKQYAEKKEQLKQLEAKQKTQEEELAKLKDKDAAILPEECPGLKVHVCTLVAPDISGGQKWDDQFVYVHAKLMLIDDTFMTLGSANINTRSMEVDSELNVAHDRPEITQPLRKRLWNLHTKGMGAQEGVTDAFQKWAKIIDRNKDAKSKNKAPIASLVEFYRGSADRTNMD